MQKGRPVAAQPKKRGFAPYAGQFQLTGIFISGRLSTVHIYLSF